MDRSLETVKRIGHVPINKEPLTDGRVDKKTALRYDFKYELCFCHACGREFGRKKVAKWKFVNCSRECSGFYQRFKESQANMGYLWINRASKPKVVKKRLARIKEKQRKNNRKYYRRRKQRKRMNI
jgi:hypothetical protein